MKINRSVAVILCLVLLISLWYFFFRNQSVDTPDILINTNITPDLESEQEEVITVKDNPYLNLGLEVAYPNDGTYVVEHSSNDTNRFTITQEHPGNRIHITRVTDTSDYPEAVGTKNIQGVQYRTFYYDGLGDGYGYMREYNGYTYVFESVYGPKNEVFETIMSGIKFK